MDDGEDLGEEATVRLAAAGHDPYPRGLAGRLVVPHRVHLRVAPPLTAVVAQGMLGQTTAPFLKQTEKQWVMITSTASRVWLP